MAKKLGRNEFPAGHGPEDFKVHGPPATKDGEFEGTCVADMGCFMQEEVDSNKYYHACVCESKKDGTFYLYVEYGRVGAANPQKQFTQCSSKAEAEREYVSQCESKNVKRGNWENHPTLGQRLVPKLDSKGKPKDLYIVRALATRDTGLPDAKTISCNEGAKAKPTKSLRSKKNVDVDSHTLKLMSDLNVAAVSYTRSSIVGNAIPTQTALDKGRDILTAALERVRVVGDDTGDQVNDKELKQLTRDMYGIIPKIKDRNAAPETWILSKDNIGLWQQDIDAFESALYATDLGDQIESDPFGGMAIKMHWIDPKSERGQFLYEWWPNATANRHGWVGSMKIKNAWYVERQGDIEKVAKVQDQYGSVGNCERPLFQPKLRSDLTREEQKVFTRTNTSLLFHGTRSVNVSGILRESLRLPKQLVGVVITGAMFGGGLYWADDWKKSAGYTSLRGSYWSGGSGSVRGRSAFMFAADVVLGKPFVAPGPRGYTSAPAGHHSVLGKAGVSQVQNNEFITYERESHRLRYLIEFDA